MITKLIFRALLYKPLSTVLSIVLLMLGTGIISMLLLMQQQLQQKFANDLKDVDIVVGVKGSPLQLVLSAVYQMDAPTGNIQKTDLDILKSNPFVKQVIPLAYGDSYKGYRIVGTDSNYIKKYNGVLRKGKLFAKPMDVVIGSNVAAKTGATLNSEFYGTHGLSKGGELHKAFAYHVAGILQPANTVLDNLVITPIESVWKIHQHHDADDEDTTDKPETQITAALVKLRSPMGLMMLPRTINQNTDMQAAVPAIEINRLFDLMGVGIITIQGIAYAIMFISGISVFISLYTRLRERRYEMALMRTMGSSRTFLFTLTIAEGLLLCVCGFVLGLFISRLGLLAINDYATENYHLSLSKLSLIKEEGYLGCITIVVGLAAAVIPAMKASGINISKTLSDE